MCVLCVVRGVIMEFSLRVQLAATVWPPCSTSHFLRYNLSGPCNLRWGVLKGGDAAGGQPMNTIWKWM